MIANNPEEFEAGDFLLKWKGDVEEVFGCHVTLRSLPSIMIRFNKQRFYAVLEIWFKCCSERK